jgi:cell division protease FtsH
MARQMVCLFGMSARVGLPQCARPEGVLGGESVLQRDCSETTAREVDEEVRRLLEEARARAQGLLERHRATLEGLIAALLEHETLGREQLAELIGPAAPRRGRGGRATGVLEGAARA